MIKMKRIPLEEIEKTSSLYFVRLDKLQKEGSLKEKKKYAKKVFKINAKKSIEWYWDRAAEELVIIYE